MYDYDVVKKVLGVKELGVPLVFRKDCMGGCVVGKNVRNMRAFLRVFVCESDLRVCREVVGRMTWREFCALYFQELRTHVQ
jgi:hypothetical protein